MFSIRDIYHVNNYRAEDVTYCEIATSGEFELKLFRARGATLKVVGLNSVS